MLAAIVLTLTCSPSSFATSSKLVSITASGSERFSEAEIVRAAGLTVGSEVRPEDFQSAATRLAATTAFREVNYRYKPTPEGLAVEFQLKDADQFVPCRFLNFPWFTPAELIVGLQSRIPLFTGEIPAAGNMQDKVAIALEQMLKQRGVTAAVRSFFEGASGKVVAITAYDFQVQGGSLPIHQIKLQGVTLDQKTMVASAVQPLFGRDYDFSMVQSFIQHTLSPLYWQLGYLRVAFADPLAAMLASQPGATQVTVTIQVREGIQYRFGQLQWVGNKLFSDNQLEKFIRLAPGKTANGLELSEDLRKAAELYATRGYIRAVIVPKPAFDDPTQTVNYQMEVHEGDLYSMGNLRLVGLDPAHLRAIQKHWRMRSGEPFDQGYVKGFISRSMGNLPPNRNGWGVNFKEKVNETAKTVDLTIYYAAAGVQ